MAASMDSDISPVESFTSILTKLATGEFASQQLPRHGTIRRQIGTLVQSGEDLQSLSKALNDNISSLMSSLSARKVVIRVSMV